MNVKNIPGLSDAQIEALEVEMKAANQRKKLSGAFIAACGKVRGDMGGDPYSVERARVLCNAFNAYTESEGSATRICIIEQTLPATTKPPTPGKVK